MQKKSSLFKNFQNITIRPRRFGRHKCAGCAYERGIKDGIIRKEKIDLKLSTLPESQAGTVRHKSPHAAYALGYLHGVKQSYNT